MMKKTILVVDDDQLTRKAIFFVLKGADYRVFSASNGVEAIEILSKESIDIIISDILMPEMDGIELSSFLVEKYPDIKIILISGGGKNLNTTDKEINNLLDIAKNISNAVSVLRKPVKNDVLLNEVSSL